jgi:hypothetical protein
MLSKLFTSVILICIFTTPFAKQMCQPKITNNSDVNLHVKGTESKTVPFGETLVYIADVDSGKTEHTNKEPHSCKPMDLASFDWEILDRKSGERLLKVYCNASVSRTPCTNSGNGITATFDLGGFNEWYPTLTISKTNRR